MYYKFLEKQFSRKPPFHQKVLHFQYDVPIKQLRKVFEAILDENENKLYTAKDFSCAERMLPTKERVAYNDSLWHPSTQERNVFGVFDDTETFYIRIEIDPLENASENNDVCGNIFLFAEEQQLLDVGNRFQATCGQMILEGTADFIALLED